jgi:hypothetical protein
MRECPIPHKAFLFIHFIFLIVIISKNLKAADAIILVLGIDKTIEHEGVDRSITHPSLLSFI